MHINTTGLIYQAMSCIRLSVLDPTLDLLECASHPTPFNWLELQRVGQRKNQKQIARVGRKPQISSALAIRAIGYKLAESMSLSVQPQRISDMTEFIDNSNGFLSNFVTLLPLWCYTCSVNLEE